MTDTTQALTTVEHRALDQAALPEAVEAALMQGDIAKLSAEHRVMYYRSVCHSLGLNYLTRPFDLIKDDSGKYQLYARKEATEQLRKLHRVSTRVVGRERLDELYIVTVQASTPQGRVEESQGIVYIGQAKGQALANALMRAETKGKRRATLAICGLGWMLVEEETRGQQMAFDPQTGVLDDEPRPALEAPAADNAPLDDENAPKMNDQPQSDADHDSTPSTPSHGTQAVTDTEKTSETPQKPAGATNAPQDDPAPEGRMQQAFDALLAAMGLSEGELVAYFNAEYASGEATRYTRLATIPRDRARAFYKDVKDHQGAVRDKIKATGLHTPLAPFKPDAPAEKDEGRLV